MAIGALLTGIGALSQAVGHGMAAFGGDDKLRRKLMIGGQMSMSLGAAANEFSKLGAGGDDGGVGLKIEQGRKKVSELAQTDGSIMSRMIEGGQGDLLRKPDALNPLKNVTPGGNPFTQDQDDGSSMQLFLKGTEVGSDWFLKGR